MHGLKRANIGKDSEEKNASHNSTLKCFHAYCHFQVFKTKEKTITKYKNIWFWSFFFLIILDIQEEKGATVICRWSSPVVWNIVSPLHPPGPSWDSIWLRTFCLYPSLLVSAHIHSEISGLVLIRLHEMLYHIQIIRVSTFYQQ